MKKIIIIIAILAISFGLYGIAGKMFVAPPKKKVEPVVVPPRTLKVWFAQRDIKMGETVERTALTLKTISESRANQLGITENVQLEFVKGALFQRAIIAGETVFSDDLVSPQDIEFIDLIIEKDRVPFALKVQTSDIIGGLIKHGSYIDILAFSDASEGGNGARSLSVSPVLMSIKVLQLRDLGVEAAKKTKDVTKKISQSLNLEGKGAPTEMNLVLELTRKQVAKLTIAQRIAELQVHKSIGDYNATDLTSNAGDVLPDYKAIKELRADQVTIN